MSDSIAIRDLTSLTVMFMKRGGLHPVIPREYLMVDLVLLDPGTVNLFSTRWTTTLRPNFFVRTAERFPIIPFVTTLLISRWSA